MIKTQKRSLRNTILFTIKTIALILIVCLVAEYPAQMLGKVLAMEKVYYVSDVKVFQAEKEEDAKRLCESEGYTCTDMNLNAGTGKDAVLMGFKLTEDKREAL